MNIEEDKDEILSWNLNGVLKYMLGVFPFTQNIVTWENKAATQLSKIGEITKLLKTKTGIRFRSKQA